MVSIPGNDHRKYNDASTWIPLFDVQLSEGEIYHLTPAPDGLIADGFTYTPFPIMLEELRDDGKGEIANVKLTISNIDGMIGNSIRQSTTPIDGQPITFKIWSIEQGAVVYQETLEIIKVNSITTQIISIDIGMFNPFLAKLLSEKFLRDFCWNRYKGRGCWVTRSNGTFAIPAGFSVGSPDSCTKKRTDCDRHNNILRFNSFPGIPGNGGFV